MTVDDKVRSLRKQMAEEGFAAWLVNGKDPHDSEYVCERWKTRQWLTGFSGSAGDVVITADRALIWVDSRYFIQCSQQIENTCFEMMKKDGPEAVSPKAWLKDNVKGRTGVCAEALSLEEKRKYEEEGVLLVPGEDLIDRVWTDRPSMPCTPVVMMSDRICGASAEEKVERIRKAAGEKGAVWNLVASLDDIAWTLNLRAADIEDTPVFLSYLLIGSDCVKLFTQKERFSGMPSGNLPFEVFPYGDILEHLSLLENTCVYLNPKRINCRLYNALKPGVKTVEGTEFSTLFKACKNRKEIAGIKKAHIADGVALVNFLARIRKNDGKLTELKITEMLEEERKKSEDYLEPSFTAIAGFGPHGAIVHYSADRETDAEICGNGLLVLDSGGQYVAGTTDVTRTLLFGKATKEQKRDYTLVLKGHLALANQCFPEGTTGHQLDVLARMFLWNRGLSYYHGSGHGVGFRLSVHEGPQGITVRPSGVALKEGMVLSDEPGLYREGKYGIRIENLITVKKAKTTEFGTFLKFEHLTCCPYERKLIDKNLLTEEEIKEIDSYHRWVYGKLHKLVGREALSYLKKATAAL